MNALQPHRRSLAIAALAAACAFGLVVALLAGRASATTYTDTVGFTGTVTISAGTLHFTSTPGTVDFGSQSLDGTDQVVASNAATEVDVTDATGSGAGWTVAASAPAFTCSACTPPSGGTATLGALEINGAGSTTATSLLAACNPACSGPGSPNHDIATNGIITVGTSTPAPFFDQSAGYGMGKEKITNVWWLLTIPYNAVAGSYSTTITLNTSSGPTLTY